MNIKKLSWQNVFDRIRETGIDRFVNVVYGIPKGGMIAAGFLQHAARTHTPADASIILDDIVDSGATRKKYMDKFPTKSFVSLVDKYLEGLNGTWVTFPWEEDCPSGSDSIEDNVTRMLQYIGEDVSRPGLIDTPRRVVRSWEELFAGYKVDIPSLFKVFDEGHDEMVLLKGAKLSSTCEHHLLPFIGTVAVGYIPKYGKVIGLSKIVRVVDAFSRRLQVQEKLTGQIASAFMEHLNPLGVGVVIKAKHSCMSLRGVQDGGSEMVTSCLRGNFRTDLAVRTEFLRLIEL